MFMDATGKPLESGFIYLGELNQNPETNPITVYYDRAQTVVAPNPIRTVGGYPARAGSPASIFTAGGYSITVKDKNGVLVFHSPANTDDAGGGQTAVIKNYISNSSFEDGTTTGWNLGRDTGTTSPTSGGIGGGASEFLPLTLDSALPLAGLNSLSLNKPAGNVQSSTLYTDNLAIDREDLAGGMYVGFSYRTPSSGYTTGDISVFLWDVEGGALVSLSTNALIGSAGAAGRFFAAFTPTSSRTYRVILMFTNASNLAAISIDLDSFFFGQTTLNTERLGGSTLIEVKRWSKENSLPVGTQLNTEVPLTPVIWGGNPDTYLPVIKRWDADHDVTSTQAPDLVTAYRAAVASINVNGAATASWTGTVSGSTITFAANAANLALINLIVNEATANGYIQTQTAGASALYSGTAQRCINVGGVDYAITNASPGGYTITVSGTPASGSQTCILYPYRIAGSTTSVRLPRLSGFVGVAQYDYDGNFVAGFRKMDQMQGFAIYIPIENQ